MKNFLFILLCFLGCWVNASRIDVLCDIFLFDDVGNSSVFEQINNAQMCEVNELVTFISTKKKVPADWVSKIKATGKVYQNSSKIFSAWNSIFYEYYDLFPKAGVSEHTVNLAILPNGNVREIKISELFESGKNWQIPLLLKGIELLKTRFQFWDKSPNSIIKDIKSGKRDFDYYFYSFVLTDKNSIIVIFQSLALAPNLAGYPSVEIPIKDLQFYKGL